MNQYTYTLSSDSHYDHQGLLFSSLVGLLLFCVFAPIVLYFNHTNILWLKRLYRPNHTLSPPPLHNSNSRGTTPLTSPTRSLNQEDNNHHHTVKPPFVEKAIKNGNTVKIRRKRIGISIPFKSSLFNFASYFSKNNNNNISFIDRYTSVEESVEHVQSVFHVEEKYKNKMENNNESGESTPISDRSEPNSVNYGSVDDVDNLPSTTIVVDAENSENNNNPENNKKSIKEYMKQFHYKKISLDPQATLYVFTLKYIFTFLLLGQVFMIAVALIANTEDAVEYYIVKKDVHSCNTTLNNNNETACLSLKPYCNYVNLSLASSLDSKNSRSSKLRSSNTFSTTKRGKSMLLAINNNVEVVGQCLPVALRGIYDFSVKNIRPSSTNWYYVALLDSAYVLLFTFLFYLFVVKKMHPYIQRVLREQIRNALGYKVVCVRGLEEEDMSSKELFKQRFLSEEAYFGEEDLPQASKNKRARAIHEDGHDYYEFMDCNGFNCLFSTFMCRYYVSSRENATFTKKNKVRQIFFSRRSPPNMYDIIHATEKSMGQLQEWVAREKAERRRLSFFSQNNNHHHHNENEEYLLETRRCIPHCLETEKAVPHYIEQFTHDAKLLNAYIEKVPLEKKNGVVYIVFDDALAAFEFINFFSMKYGGWHSNATVSLAGPPGHLIENNIKASKVALLVRFLCLFLFYVVLLFTWSIPVGFVSSIDNLASIPTVGNIFYKYYTDEVPTVIRNFITTFLPVVMLGLFNIILPFLIRFIVLLMGAINKNECDGGHLFLQYVFMILTAVLFQAPFQGFTNQVPDWIQLNNDGKHNATNAGRSGFYNDIYNFSLSSSTTTTASPFNNNSYNNSPYPATYFTGGMETTMAPIPPTPPPPPPYVDRFSDRYSRTDLLLNFAVDCYSPQGGYWFAKVITAIAFSCWIDLIDIIGLLKCVLLKRKYKVQRQYNKLFVPSFNFEFPRNYAFDMMILSMGLIFHLSTPLLHVLVCLYFAVRFWTQRGKILDRYRSIFPEPLLQNCTDFTVSAQIMHCVMGLFLLSEIGAVLLHLIRGTVFSFVISLLNLAVAILLLVWTLKLTTTWSANLHNVRQIFLEDEKLESEQKKKQQEEVKKANENTRQRREGSEEEEMQSKTDSGKKKSITFRVDDNKNENENNNNTDEGSEHSSDFASPVIHLSESFAGNLSIYRSEREKVAEEEKLLTQLLNNTMMDNYETYDFSGIFFDDGNPYTGELLPKKRKIQSLYQPKHQKLERMDVEEEVEQMLSKEYIVERYWDTHISWFENDVEEEGGETHGVGSFLSRLLHTVGGESENNRNNNKNKKEEKKEELMFSPLHHEGLEEDLPI